jgi:hypothetical protein
MDQGLAIVLAAVITVGGVAVGLVGVLVGGRISAGASRDAAKIAADAAREAALTAKAASDADREAARAAQFAERLCDLGARMLDISDRWVREIESAHVRGRRQNRDATSAWEVYRKVSQELRLLVRLEETYSALISLINRTDYLSLAAGDDTWDISLAQQRASRARFEDAIRAELGRDVVSRPWFVKGDGKYADGD